ncbi:nucleoside deaminase [Gimesia aquarii]|uniref:Guanine deaminase n=1 Tax=Gimesia aquarii TaxID=2527964 RepID=A0A517VXP6_9PLAN|nr:nucleoside deaminase [Gimesia aquarii]QDT97780.1 Guanine deaminase [Gimesia aquarii]
MTQWISTISLGAVIAIASIYWVVDESQSQTVVSPNQKSVKYVGSGTDYEGVPQSIDLSYIFTSTRPPCTECSHSDSSLRHKYQCQQHNIKRGKKYRGIEVGENRWIKMACEEAHQSVKEGGGPFGAVIVQIDDASNQVIRFWRCRNQVTRNIDPTAHAEVSAIRTVASELGVFDLGDIRRDDPRLKLAQSGETSHCEIYSSCEPCPMCYAAIRWARIDTIVFSATRFDAAEPGVDFSDLNLYEELATPYQDRDSNGLRVYQATTTNSLDAFNLWKNIDKVTY